MLTYSALREIQKKEMESAAIVSVDENFYEGVATLLQQKKEEARSSGSLLIIREYENIKKIVQSLQSKREEKIALMALRGETEGNGLPLEERVLLSNVGRAIQTARASVKDVWERDEAPLPRKVRILQEVDKYKGLDNRVYGPFKDGEEIALPAAEAEWLLKAHMAEAVV